eukprot:TRINITY_DN3594_c5_g1_i1.p1 TRINITY_DN3594_c5_g1~~TRINITY_DN3594_c5_g1_i1.p1  ORF type:complete len:408 (+),score=111.19 TRINITY_DN3594_c5_g1_i1:46-1269(+)
MSESEQKPVEEPVQTEPAQDAGVNPLVMEEVKGNKVSNKKKKAAAEAKKNLDLLTAKIKEKMEEQEFSANHAPAVPAEDPVVVGMRIFNEGGEAALKEEARKCLAEQNKLNRELQKEKRKNEQLNKEKDRITVEINEHKIGQQKAQIKCLDLQKHIKTLKEAASKMETEKEDQRLQSEMKFQSAIDEITSKLGEGSKDRESLYDENKELAEKVASIEGEFEKYQKLHEEKGAILDQKKRVLVRSEEEAALQRQRSRISEENLLMTLRNCKDLLTQIKMYKERMIEFEASIEKSQGLFGGFATELVKMKKHIGLLRQTRDVRKSELTKAEKGIVDYQAQRVRLRKEIEAQTVQNTRQKEAANKLSTKRAQFSPYFSHIAEWKKSLHVDPNEKPATESKENCPPPTNSS